jgi:predicted dehydrogenase
MHGLRWGILGTGRMADQMAAELNALRSSGMELTAVASRALPTAQAFAAKHGIGRAWGRYADIAQDDGVDIIYVATPHSEHYDNAMRCLRGGKAVLCEKPFTLNARQARSLIEEARLRRLFLMEAMWTRFVPAVVALRELLASGAIGPVRLVVGGGAFVPQVAAGHYLWDPELGGGVLLDAGVYLVSMASMILGEPSRIMACGVIGDRGVDEQDCVTLEQPDGSMAQLYVSMRARRAPDLEILGEGGRIRVAAPVFRPASLTLWARDGAETNTQYPLSGSGYGYQLREAAVQIAQGRIESPVMPLDETLSVMKTMDAIRAQIGLRFPGELH